VRKLKCFEVHGVNVQDVLDEFNERAQDEFGIKPEHVLSVSVLPPPRPVKIATPTGTADARVQVVIIYWADE
jgi:hypothetical protein